MTGDGAGGLAEGREFDGTRPVVLVATAGTEYDQDAIEEAVGLLGAGHRYVFLTVYQGVIPAIANLGSMWAPAVVPDMASWDDADHAAEQAGRLRLQTLADRLHVNAELRVESGDPAERICTTAAEENVDLIVIGSPHTNVLRRILGRSISDEVAHHASCPVLLIRHHDADTDTDNTAVQARDSPGRATLGP